MSKKALRLSPASLKKLRRSLLDWYEQNRRDLPWRRDPGPYQVWISEIMLQQTRVAAVLDYYARFLQRFPTVQSLAAAREASVLAAWSGLGYYHRARRMHQAAKVIARERQGIFPRSAEEWRKLPGIGRYTAAAIGSIAFGEAVGVVDGNVERVLDRMFGHDEGTEVAWQRADMLLDRDRPGDFNQAMMELGATTCTPRTPQCLLCPLNTWCQSRGAQAVQPQAPRKRNQLCYALTTKNGAVLLVRRPTEVSLMAGMWELPCISKSQCDGHKPVAKLRHSITDTDYEVSVFSFPKGKLPCVERDARWSSPKQWQKLPLTGLTRKILRRLTLESPQAPAESNLGSQLSRRT